MKKIVALILSSVLLLSLIGCSSTKTNAQNQQSMDQQMKDPQMKNQPSMDEQMKMK